MKGDGVEPRLEVDDFFGVYIGARWPSEAGAWSGRGAASEWRATGWRSSSEPCYKLNVYFCLCTQEQGG